MPSRNGLDWVLIRKFGDEPIGAVGFVGDDIVAIIAFHDDRDGDRDGKVGVGEWIAAKISPFDVKGMAVTEVAMQARVEPDILLRDQSIATISSQMFLNFAVGLVKDGIYAAYFKPGVSMAGKGIAKRVTDSTVKQIAIRKGFETAAEEAFMAAVDR